MTKGPGLILVLTLLLSGPECLFSQSQPVKMDKVPVRYLSPEEVALISKAVVHARVESIVSDAENGIIYTVVKCSVVDSMGSCLKEGGFEIRQPGGSLGSLRTWSGPIPVWQAGEEWIFGLTSPFQGVWTVVGIKQGAFRVEKESAVRDYEGLAFAEQPPVTILDGREVFSLEELKSRLCGASEVKATQSHDSPVDSGALSREAVGNADFSEDPVPGERPQIKSSDDDYINRLPSVFLVIVSVIMVISFLFKIYRGKKRK